MAVTLADPSEVPSAAPADPLRRPQGPAAQPPTTQEQPTPAPAPEPAPVVPRMHAETAPPPETIAPEVAAAVPETPAQVAETAASTTTDAAPDPPPPTAIADGIPSEKNLPAPGAVPTALAAGADFAAAPGKPSEADLRLLDEAIQNRLRYPTAARRRGVQGTVELEITVNDKGALDRCEIAASSGSSILDDAALRLLSGLFPFKKRLGGAFSTRIAIVYRLD